MMYLFSDKRVVQILIHYLVLTTNLISEGDLSNSLRLVKEKGPLFSLHFNCWVFWFFQVSFIRSIRPISDDASLERCEIFFNANPFVLWFFS